MLVGQFLSRSICNAVGYAYPIYMSVKVAAKDDAVDEQIQWVVFWTVNACFSVFEIIADRLGSFIPLYYEAKVCMMAWLALPYFRGATQIYEKLLAPYFVKYEQSLDASIDLASDKLSQLCREAASLAIQKGSGAIVQGQQYIVMQAMQQAWNRPTSPTSAPIAAVAKPVEPEPIVSPSPLKQPPTPPSEPPSRQEKEAELLVHFRILLSRGLKVRHGAKSRLLRLSPSGTHLYLESKAHRGAAAPVVLSLLAVAAVDAKDEAWFKIDTTTIHHTLALDAEVKKTRDLLVAGLRLLVLAFQKDAKRPLQRLAQLRARHAKQLAFDMLLDHVNRANLQRSF
ncbi:hypothetical protein SPRG_06644 [Saprolegnia parasitica CBS 223.65]|uniref:Receptor expression-enhancing protein n=1 Tax=Saprolegnia parasitica (strain CBS 223.65) TaxID=695850 RepID=A0A067CNL1_SAPPC|nr:hypothetical protein SPRG_06644 [Saprolegnia parasitica CBS 223.65]KDO28407.1 hypothetical protein SPRG_06644 [Saprolegnia parasitica CBS 223.65]|eukprot:XP_012200848.1 hypothetical protein SPRG_06644 [Saprolegnia parasitica CBS 223.65]